MFSLKATNRLDYKSYSGALNEKQHTAAEVRNGHFSLRNIPGQLVKSDKCIATDVQSRLLSTPQEPFGLNVDCQQFDSNSMTRCM